MATTMEAASMILTRDDLEVMDECMAFRLRMMRSQIITSWKDREYYNKVKALRKNVEKVLDSFIEIEALREEE